MIMDSTAEFCDATSVAAAASVALVGNVMDLGADGRDIGNSGPLFLVITCSTDIITGGAAGTISFQLASDAQAAIAVDGTASEHIITRAFITDDATPNELDSGQLIVAQALPMAGLDAYERYLGILVTIATTTVTAGAINAFLTPDVAAWRAVADGIN